MGRYEDEDDVVLVCPEAARPGQPIFFRDGGEKCKTTVPRGVRPGQKFTVRRSECRLNPRKAPASRPASAQPLLRDPKKAQPVPKLATEKAAPDPMDLMMPRSLRRAVSRPEITAADRVLIDRYKARQRAGMCQDEGFWKQQGFRAAGDPDALTAAKKKDYGFGAPKWSPYYRQSDKVMSQAAKERGAKALGDQAWWEQYGFKGAISEDKKRDYGNGVPGWSPYHRADDLKPGEVREKTNLPADAFWFQQWGFRTGEISEEKRRDYGFGVPMWSPYYRSQRGGQDAGALGPPASGRAKSAK